MISAANFSLTQQSMDNITHSPAKTDKKNSNSVIPYAVSTLPHADSVIPATNILTRHPALGYLQLDKRKCLFSSRHFHETVFCPRINIVRPSDLMLTAMADYYKKKYNINIKIVSNDYVNFDGHYSVSQALAELAEKLKDNSQLGIILKAGFAHVIPVIISKYDQKCFLIAMDSLGHESEEIITLYIELCRFANDNNEKCGEERYFPVFTDLRRQADHYSCKNDALLILKDALREQNIVDQLNFPKETHEYIFRTECSPAPEKPFILTAHLPVSLHKTVQIKTVLDKIPAKDRQLQLKKTVTPGKTTTTTKTFQDHLERYTRPFSAIRTLEQRLSEEENLLKSESNPHPIVWKTTVEEKEWQINTYLQAKPYRWVVKAYERLKGENGELNPETIKKLKAEFIYQPTTT